METPSDQLKLLSDYTLFHVGLYTTLVGALTALAHFRGPQVQQRLFWCLLFTVVCFLAAGVAGGAIASNIPNYAKFSDFDHARLNVFGVATMTYRSWAHVEHAAFWLGLVVSIIGFFAR